MSSQNKRRQTQLLLVLGAVCLFLFFSLVPTVKYHPSCSSTAREPVYLHGPLRPEYRDFLVKILEEEEFYYWNINGNIYLRHFNFFDGGFFKERYDLFNNTEWQVISGLANGYLASNQRAAPPKALLEAIRATEHKHDKSDSRGSSRSSDLYRDCDVKRAGAIWVEKLDETTGS